MDISGMAEHFVHYTKELVGQPEMSIANLDRLTQSERQQLLVDFNQTDALPQAYALTLHEAFERQADLQPQAIALYEAREDVLEHVTYGTLESRSNQLAHYPVTPKDKASWLAQRQKK